MGELNSYQIKCEFIKKLGGIKMVKKFWWLSITLLVFGGIFVSLSASYAMNKTDKPVSFGCDTKLIKVQKNAANWSIKWQYDLRLEGTQVKINLYRNGTLLRAIAENVSIGKNGRGAWQGTWDDFFYTPPVRDLKVQSYASPDWWVKGVDNPVGKVNGAVNKGYQIEIISLTNSNLRVMGDNASWDWGN